MLVQQGGLGGPYASVSVAALVANGLSAGFYGTMAVNGQVVAQQLTGQIGAFTTVDASVVNATALTVLGQQVATENYVLGLRASSVTSFNQRVGDIWLTLNDILWVGGAPINSPLFTGCPTGPTAPPGDNSPLLATTAFVTQAIAAKIDNESPIINNAVLTGSPTAPTQPPGDNSTLIATTAFVTAAVNTLAGQVTANLANYALIHSPNFTGFPNAPTANPGTSTGQIATTAFVMNAVQASTTGVSSWNTRTGAVVMDQADITAAGGAVLASPNFTGVPQAPTAMTGTNTAQLATCAFVLNEIGGASIGVMTWNGRGGAVVMVSADITNAGGALLASPNFSGTPTAPTPASTDSTDTLATTAFVHSAISTAGVSSFNGRTGAITLNSGDVSGAGAALINSPTFTGVPLSPTALVGDNSQQIANTAFVRAAITSGAVASFNGRTGAVTLTAADITAAGGAPIASPTFTGAVTLPGNSAGPLQAVTQQQLTGGYLPLAATFTTQAIFDAFLGEPWEGRTFYHGHTYTGNPLACAAALASLDLFEKNDVVAKVARLGI